MKILLSIGLTLLASAPLSAATFSLAANTTITWANKSQASQLLVTPDSFTAQLSRFDRAVRLGRDNKISQEDLLRHVGQQALDWTPNEIKRFRDSLERIKLPLQLLNLPFPSEILLIKTTGKDEPAPYTRQHGIILPKSVVGSARKPDGLLAHELFHVLTRNAPPEFRSRLYQVIGFEPCGPIELPADLKEKRITNPDAPIYDHYIKVKHGGKTKSAIPVLLTNKAEFDPSSDAPFFSYLEQRLLEIEKTNGVWQPTFNGTEAAILKIDEVENFYPQIGGKRYSVFQPEEILARHFTSIVMKTEIPDDTSVTSRLKTALKASE